jgi:hypothetical protein
MANDSERAQQLLAAFIQADPGRYIKGEQINLERLYQDYQALKAIDLDKDDFKAAMERYDLGKLLG